MGYTMIRARRNKRRRKKKEGRKKREMIGVQLARRFCIAIYRRWIYGRFADKLVKCGRTGTWVRRSFTRAPNLGTGRRGCIYIYIYIRGVYRVTFELRANARNSRNLRPTYLRYNLFPRTYKTFFATVNLDYSGLVVWITYGSYSDSTIFRET